MTALDIVLILAVAALAGVYISWRAGRLDRLHARVEAARSALEAALLRRNLVATELASSGLLDPATSVLLAEAARDTRSGSRPRELAESDLSRALRAVFGQPGLADSLRGARDAEDLLVELEAAAHQVFLARKFYNDAVAATNLARRRVLVRLLRLAGSATAPEFFDIDDSLADGLSSGGADMPRLTG